MTIIAGSDETRPTWVATNTTPATRRATQDTQDHTMTTTPDTMTFGIELETIARGSLADTVAVLRAAGINATTGQYSTRNRADEWLVKPDGSLSAGGREIVSPVLVGAAGLEMARRVADALAASGHTADRSCGMHVHIGAAGFTAREIAAVWARYNILAADIVATLAPSRATNYYCNTTAPATARAAFDRMPAGVAIDGVPYAVGAGNRYAAVNLTPLGRAAHARTFEFRQHQGTVSGDRVVNWVRFLTHFVAETARLVNAAGAPTATRSNPFKRSSSAQARMWDALNGGAPMTADSIAATVGIEASRVPGQIANMRRNCAAHGAPVDVVVRRARRGAATTYQFAHAARTAAGGAVVWGAAFDGIPGDVVEYMATRRAYFAARTARP
jgi:hypothetical protein